MGLRKADGKILLAPHMDFASKVTTRSLPSPRMTIHFDLSSLSLIPIDEVFDSLNS